MGFATRQDASLFQIDNPGHAAPSSGSGFVYSLVTGNESNMNGYSLMILFFSLLNADVLVKGEKLSNKVLDVLAKANCVLLFLWAAATIVHVPVK